MIEYTVQVWEDGSEFWFKEGKYHRENGPAITRPAYKAWYKEGKLHREDGPAVEGADGSKSWFLNDVELTQEDNAKAVDPKPFEGKKVTIDGVEYTLE